MSRGSHSVDVPSDAARIGPADPRYRAVVEKQFNKRFSASPDYVRLLGTPDQVISALEDAVRERSRFMVTSGGHCLEGFVSDPEVRVILDISPMKRIYHDRAMAAIAVEAGATVGETFQELFDNWNIVVPLGEYPAIGMGGHVAGGAFGFLCRQLGLAADYLAAVEVVTVDRSGTAQRVIARRERADPHHDLWWAHTGGGAGNFGVVTRYWFRSQGASGSDPATLLPRAPESITTFRAEWSWNDIDEQSFVRLLQNHGAWCEQNSDADSVDSSLWTLFEIHRKQFGTIIYRGVSTAGRAAERQWNDHLAALSQGVRPPSHQQSGRMGWLEFALNPFPDLFAMPPGGARVKVKDALLKSRLRDQQISVVHHYLTRTDHDVMGGMFGLATYGGRINSVSPDATASSQRNAILDMACTAGWMDPTEEAMSLDWVRGFYRDLFLESGGVPMPGERYDGTLINHPDTDLTEPRFNTSDVPWSTLYYQLNYPRLQRIKARYDPLNLFRHALSVRPPEPADPPVETL